MKIKSEVVKLSESHPGGKKKKYDHVLPTALTASVQFKLMANVCVFATS